MHRTSCWLDAFVSLESGHLRSRGNLRPPAGFLGVNPPGLQPQPLRQAGGAAAQESNAGDADRVRLPQGTDTSFLRGGDPFQVSTLAEHLTAWGFAVVITSYLDAVEIA